MNLDDSVVKKSEKTVNKNKKINAFDFEVIMDLRLNIFELNK